jgi:prepilin-type N-terminal cleavage/methylation domain-containing protein
MKYKVINRKVKINRKGFTLVELLIVMSILVLLMIAVIGALNPTLMVNKAKDSVKKKDLNRIKTAFEEYVNDKGKYPGSIDIYTWNVKKNCGKIIAEMSNYLPSWPCDPNGNPYTIIMADNWYKVVTNLDNKDDKDIPDGW